MYFVVSWQLLMLINKNKTIIITGGSVGIGSVIANKCASEGAEVIIVARNKKDLDSSLNNLKTISDKNHRSYSLDVKDLNAIKAFAIWLENEGLIINGLVNCAGVYGPIGKTTDVDMDKLFYSTAAKTLRKKIKEIFNDDNLTKTYGINYKVSVQK